MQVKKLTSLSLLLALSLVIFTAEAQLPPPVPIPGIKLGLANIITLVTMELFGRKEAFYLLALRIVLGNIFAGSMTGFIYSMAGGLLCFAVMGMLIGVFGRKQLWTVSVFGAVAHNTGQLAAALLITSVKQIIWYFPILMVSAVITGTFTGISAMLTLKALSFERRKKQ